MVTQVTILTFINLDTQPFPVWLPSCLVFGVYLSIIYIIYIVNKMEDKLGMFNMFNGFKEVLEHKNMQYYYTTTTIIEIFSGFCIEIQTIDLCNV